MTHSPRSLLSRPGPPPSRKPTRRPLRPHIPARGSSPDTGSGPRTAAPSPDNDTAKRARSTAGTLPYVATRTISSGPSSERAPSNGSAIVFQRGSVSSGGLHPGTGPQDGGRATSPVFSIVLRRSRAFISLGFPEAPFHTRSSHTFRSRALRETADAASSRIVSRIVVVRGLAEDFHVHRHRKL